MVFERSFIRLLAVAPLLATVVSAFPSWRVSRRDDVGFLDDVLLFDAPAVLSDPPVVEIQAYVFVRQLDLGPLTDGINSILSGLGDLGDIGESAAEAGDRIKLFGSIPRSGKNVQVTIDGCGDVELSATDDEGTTGVSVTNVTCSETGLVGGTPSAATAEFDLRQVTSRIFPSPPDGFGVISDLDDTIKISNVLDKVELAKNTLFEEPKIVPGMPELYASLQQSLNDPLFSYVSGSPFQLFPFVQPFIDGNYPPGPKFLRNLTVFDIPNLIDTLTDEDSTLKFKGATIDRLVGLYPQKKFLMIGDSTEKDAETYAEAFRKYGAEKVPCIWIREVDGADNTEERFAASLAGVPAENFRTFTDAEIPGLADIDVAGGSC